MAMNDDGVSRTVRARVREFTFPPIRDGLVIGREAPIGAAALQRAVQLLVSAPFELLAIDDAVISDVLVRAAILRRVPQQALIDFVLRKIKPHMGHDEVLHFDLDAEVITEERGL
jgi:hypothetical protein